jgi:hypothetical protein
MKEMAAISKCVEREWVTGFWELGSLGGMRERDDLLLKGKELLFGMM